MSDAVEEFCRKCKLAVTNTFSCHQSERGLAGAFILPNGLTLACDYVLLNGGVSVAKGSCCVWADFNMLYLKHDHLPVCVVAAFQCVKALPVYVKYDLIQANTMRCDVKHDTHAHTPPPQSGTQLVGCMFATPPCE